MKSAVKQEKKIIKAEGQALVGAKDAKKKAQKKSVKKLAKHATTLEQLAVRSSDYLASLLDPVNNPGAKIPDEVSTASYTGQTVSRYLLTTTAPALGNAGIGMLFRVGASAALTTDIAAINVISAVASSTNWVVQTLAAAPGGQAVPPWIASFAAGAAMCRVVSSELYATYQGSPNNATGRLIAGYSPPNSLVDVNVTSTSTPSSSTFTNNNPCVEIPTSKAFASCRFTPNDPIDRVYHSPGVTVIGSGALRPNGSNNGTLYILADGAPAGTVVEFVHVTNWELVPSQSVYNLVNPTPSRSDSLEMDAVTNVMGGNPLISVEQSTPDIAAGTPFAEGSSKGGFSKSEANHASFSDMALGLADQATNWVKDKAPVALKALEGMGGIAAMLL